MKHHANWFDRLAFRIRHARPPVYDPPTVVLNRAVILKEPVRTVPGLSIMGWQPERTPGAVYIDDFEGTDDEKLRAAIAYADAHRRMA